MAFTTSSSSHSDHFPLCFEQAEKELAELSFQMDSLTEKLDEADGLTSAQVLAIDISLRLTLSQI